MNLRLISPVTGLLALMAATVSAAFAEDAPLNLEGQTIRFLIASSVGGGTDLQGRLIARYLTKHLPGNPAVLPQNITGGNGLKMLAHFNSLDPKTDLVIATINSNMPFRARSGAVPADAFDPRTAGWIGSAVDSTNICMISAAADTGEITSLRTKELNFATSQKSSGSHAVYMIVNRGLGFRIKSIIGYETNAMAMATARAEVDGYCMPKSAYSTVKPFVDDGKVRVFMYVGQNRRDDLAAAYLFDLDMSAEQRDFLKLALASISFGRPLAVRSDADPRFIGVVRESFRAMAEDPEYRAEAAKLGIDVRYTSPEAILQAVNDLYATSDGKIAEIAELIGAE